MAEQHSDLTHDPGGVASVAEGSPTDHAINRLFRPALVGSKRAAPTGEVVAEGLSRSHCRRRFRRRVLYPVLGIFLAPPVFVFLAGGGARYLIGETDRGIGGVVFVVLVWLVGAVLLGLLLTPIWIAEYRKRVGTHIADGLKARADAHGLEIMRDSVTRLSTPWPELTLVSLARSDYSAGPDRTRWDAEFLTLRDAAGREITLPIYQMTRGHDIARRIVQELIDHARLARVPKTGPART